MPRYVGMNELEIEEDDEAHGLKTNVLYFTLPGEKFNGIVRRTTFKNTGTTTLGKRIEARNENKNRRYHFQ